MTAFLTALFLLAVPLGGGLPVSWKASVKDNADDLFELVFTGTESPGWHGYGTKDPFSATTLIPGRTLTITGANLQGATEVLLPLAFDGSISCDLDGPAAEDGTSVKIVIPDGVTFASGLCEIVMEKYDSYRDLTYTEKAFSEKTDFRN